MMFRGGFRGGVMGAATPLPYNLIFLLLSCQLISSKTINNPPS